MNRMFLRCLCAVLIVLICLPAHSAYARENLNSSRRIVSVVYDDSGSMSENGSVAWSEASYSMQLLSAMMANQDKLFISYMSDRVIAREILLDDRRQSVADDIRAHFETSSTPLETVETAYNALVNSDEHADGDEYWLLIFTDGGFQISGGTGQPYARERFNELIHQYAQTPMPNGTSLNIIYLAMGENAHGLTVPALPNVEEYICGRDNLVGTLSDISCFITGKYLFTQQNGSINPVSNRAVEITTPLPLHDITVIAQGKPAKVVSAENVLSGDALKIGFTVTAKYPEQKGYQSNTGLHGVLSRVAQDNGVIPGGTYRLEFDSAFDISNLSVLGELAAELRISVADSQTGAPVTNPSQLYDNAIINAAAIPYGYQTDARTDLSVLGEHIQYSFQYRIGGEVKRQTRQADMELSALSLEGNENCTLEAKITVGQSVILRESINFQPKKYITYRIEAEDGEGMSVRRHSLRGNNTGITFCVYKDDVRISDVQELMRLRPQFTISGNIPLSSLDVTYTRNGYIVCVPKFGFISPYLSAVFNWLSSYLVPLGESQITASFFTEYSANAVVAEAGWSVISEPALLRVLHYSAPFLLILLVFGYISKPRFRKKATLRFAVCNEEDGVVHSGCNFWGEIPIYGNIRLQSFIPFAADRIRGNGLLIRAKGTFFSKRQRISVKNLSRSVSKILLAEPSASNAEGAFALEINNPAVQAFSSKNKRFTIRYNQAVLLNERKGFWMVYIMELPQKQNYRSVFL